MEHQKRTLENFFQTAKKIHSTILETFASYAKRFRFKRNGPSNLVASISSVNMEIFGKYVEILDEEAVRDYQLENITMISARKMRGLQPRI